MGQTVITKLFKSFDELERTIQLARHAVVTKDPVPFELLRRIDTYDKTLQQQRRLGQSLCDLVAEGNWPEVSKHVKMINGLSALIHTDAMELVSEVLGTPHAEKADVSTRPALTLVSE